MASDTCMLYVHAQLISYQYSKARAIERELARETQRQLLVEREDDQVDVVGVEFDTCAASALDEEQLDFEDFTTLNEEKCGISAILCVLLQLVIVVTILSIVLYLISRPDTFRQSYSL